jgi:hypothetical protein
MRFYAFKQKGSFREAQIVRVQELLFPLALVTRNGGLPFEVTASGDSSYRIVVKALKPGEYGFLMSWSYIDKAVPNGWNVFDFAVDP